MRNRILSLGFFLILLIPIKASAVCKKMGPDCQKGVGLNKSQILQYRARLFFNYAAKEDIAGILALSESPFSLNGRIIQRELDLKKQFIQMRPKLRKISQLIRGIKAMTYRELVKQAGPPPARLKGEVEKSAGLVLCQLPQGGLILIFQKSGQQYYLTGIAY